MEQVLIGDEMILQRENRRNHVTFYTVQYLTCKMSKVSSKNVFCYSKKM